MITNHRVYYNAFELFIIPMHVGMSSQIDTLVLFVSIGI